MKPQTNIALRPIETEDLDLLVAWRNHPEVATEFFNVFPLSRAGQSDWFESYLQRNDEQLFIIVQANGKPIGTVGLSNIDFKNQKAEFGRLLIGPPEYRGKGYGKQATLLTLSLGFAELNLNKIYLHVFADNKHAVSLYSSCGFIEEGVFREEHFSRGAWRDVARMSVLRREYSRMMQDEV